MSTIRTSRGNVCGHAASAKDPGRRVASANQVSIRLTRNLVPFIAFMTLCPFNRIVIGWSPPTALRVLRALTALKAAVKKAAAQKKGKAKKSRR